MKEQQFYFGSRSCSLPLKGIVQQTDDGNLSLSCVIGGKSYVKMIQLPDTIEEVSRLVVREEPLCILVCYETHVVEIDGSKLVSNLLQIPEQDGDNDLPLCPFPLMTCRVHNVQLPSSLVGCCFSPCHNDVYFVVDYRFSFSCYSTQRHTDVPLFQFSLREYLDSQLSLSLLSAHICDVTIVPTTVQNEVAVAFLLSSGFWIVVEGLPLQSVTSSVHFPPLCPRVDDHALRVHVSGSALSGTRLRHAFTRKCILVSSVTTRLCSIGDQTVYVVASALAVVVTLYSPSRRGFSTLAVHDLSLLGLEKPSFLLNPVRAEMVVEQGACSKVIAFGEVLRAVRGESVWGEDTTPSVPEVKERRAGSVPEVLLRATASQERAVYVQEVARKEVQCMDRLYEEMDEELGMEVMNNPERVDSVLASLAPWRVC